MNKFFAGVMVGFLASCGLAFASSGLGHNGIFWNKLSAPAKDGYVNGYSDAMKVSVGQLDSLQIAADMFHWKGARKFIKQLSRELSMADLTPNQAVDRLNELYSNPKYSELDLGQALQLLTTRANETALPSGRGAHRK
jgi:hypothetical protein